MLEAEAQEMQPGDAVQLTTDEVDADIVREDVQHRNDRLSTFPLLHTDVHLYNRTPPCHTSYLHYTYAHTCIATL